MKPRPVVICSILERDAAATERALQLVPRGAALTELRGDHLRAEELAGLVRGARGTVIATIRRPIDGGGFTGSEDERRHALGAALAAGAAYVDVEWDSGLRDLACGAWASRAILSHHAAGCALPDLLATHRAMAATPAAQLKVVPAGESVTEAVIAVRRLLDEAGAEGRLACFAQGRAGAVTRLLAPSWGSWATYGSSRPGHASAPGQFTAEEMLDSYRVLDIASATRRFALVGSRVLASPSPAMHHAGFAERALDACYLPIELDQLSDCLALLGPDGLAGIEALAVTIPFKEEAATRCSELDEWAKPAGAVNTVLLAEQGWRGLNTDAPAALGLLARHPLPAGAVAAVVGAGGTARAIAAALRAAGFAVTLFNRSEARAQRVACELGIAAQPLTALAAFRWDLLIQATPLGADGETMPPVDRLRGRVVLDVAYGTQPTPLVRRARAAGLLALDGFELLVAQALLQFERMNGVRPSRATLEQAGRSWLARRAG